MKIVPNYLKKRKKAVLRRSSKASPMCHDGVILKN